MADLKYKTHRPKAKKRLISETPKEFTNEEKLYNFLVLNGYKERGDKIRVHCIDDRNNYFRVNWWNNYSIRRSQIYELVFKPGDKVDLIEIM